MFNITLGPEAINQLTLTAIKLDLHRCLETGAEAWGLSIPVAEVILSLTRDQVSFCSNRCSNVQQHLVRLGRHDDSGHWYELRSLAEEMHDSESAVDSLVDMLMPTQAAANPFQRPTLSASGLRNLILSTVKVHMTKSLAAACQQWNVSIRVGEIIASMSDAQISAIANMESSSDLIRLTRPSNVSFWLDLARASQHRDAAGVDLSVLTSIFLPPVADRAFSY